MTVQLLITKNVKVFLFALALYDSSSEKVNGIIATSYFILLQNLSELLTSVLCMICRIYSADLKRKKDVLEQDIF